VLVPAGVTVAGWLPDDPFEQEVVDRSTPPLVLALQDLNEYHAATGTFQVVLDRDRGLVERIGDALDDDPVDDGEVYALAEDRLTAAAAESDLLERAETNTRGMLTSLARSLGVDEVTVEFEEPARDAG
jgi:hypothetical protein